MSRYEMRTKNGYSLYTIASALQKAIRRGETELAVFAGLELLHSNYYNYVWKRLLTVSAEDCYGIITKEVVALKYSFDFVNEKNTKSVKGRIFLTKAILLLCESIKSRDTDHLQNIMYDNMKIDEERLLNLIAEAEAENQIEIPEYVYDIHTKEGRLNGKTKKDFLKDEQACLKPKQMTMFPQYTNL